MAGHRRTSTLDLRHRVTFLDSKLDLISCHFCCVVGRMWIGGYFLPRRRLKRDCYCDCVGASLSGRRTGVIVIVMQE